MEVRGGSARPGQFTSDKSSRKPGTGHENRYVENLFEQMDAGLVRRQVGSASDAPTPGRRRRCGGGTPRHIGSGSACRRPVLLDGEPGRILGLDLDSARVARRDTGARRSNSRGPPRSGESHRSEPAAKPISSGGRTRWSTDRFQRAYPHRKAGLPLEPPRVQTRRQGSGSGPEASTGRRGGSGTGYVDRTVCSDLCPRWPGIFGRCVRNDRQMHVVGELALVSAWATELHPATFTGGHRCTVGQRHRGVRRVPPNYQGIGCCALDEPAGS
jgi:hypothetical protein